MTYLTFIPIHTDAPSVSPGSFDLPESMSALIKSISRCSASSTLGIGCTFTTQTDTQHTRVTAQTDTDGKDRRQQPSAVVLLLHHLYSALTMALPVFSAVRHTHHVQNQKLDSPGCHPSR